MIYAIKNRIPFSKDLLLYAWFNVEQVSKTSNVFESKLWKTLMTTYEEILGNISDKKGWEWFKEYFINSLIWFLPHPQYHQS